MRFQFERMQRSRDARAVSAPLGAIKTVTARSVSKRLASGEPLVLIDVREPEEFTGPLGHIPGSRLIPLGALGVFLEELATQSSGAPIVFVCRSGAHSLTAAALAQRAGIPDVASMEGGMLAWNSLD